MVAQVIVVHNSDMLSNGDV